jgi:hypothetical protein
MTLSKRQSVTELFADQANSIRRISLIFVDVWFALHMTEQIVAVRKRVPRKLSALQIRLPSLPFLLRF